MILNAASVQSSIFSLLPNFISRHYLFLKDKYPSTFPVLTLYDTIGHDISSMQDLVDYNTAYSEIAHSFTQPLSFGPQFSLHALQTKLSKLEERCPYDFKPTFAFYQLQAQIVTHLNQLSQFTPSKLPLVTTVMDLTYLLEHAYYGLSHHNKRQLKLFRIYADVCRYRWMKKVLKTNTKSLLVPTITPTHIETALQSLDHRIASAGECNWLTQIKSSLHNDSELVGHRNT